MPEFRNGKRVKPEHLTELFYLTKIVEAIALEKQGLMGTDEALYWTDDAVAKILAIRGINNKEQHTAAIKAEGWWNEVR